MSQVSVEKEEGLVDIQNIVAELKSERDRIDQAIGVLEGNTPTKTRVGRPPASAGGSRRTGRGGGLTPAGRRRLSEAMKRRWAQRRRGITGPAKVSPRSATKPKKRGGITAAGRKKLSEAMKRRWAERRRKAT